MKNLTTVLFLAVILTLCTLDLQAQDKEPDRVGGIRFGWHSSQFSKDGEAWSDESMQSFYAGFFRDNKIVPMFHFGTGLEYYKNGVKFDSDNHRDFHYVSVPLNGKFKLGPAFALAGFAPSFKVAERIVTDGDSQKPTDAQKAEWFDIPFYVGAGVKLLFITIEARYHWGLLEVVDGYKANSFQLGLGLSF